MDDQRLLKHVTSSTQTFFTQIGLIGRLAQQLLDERDVFTSLSVDIPKRVRHLVLFSYINRICSLAARDLLYLCVAYFPLARDTCSDTPSNARHSYYLLKRTLISDQPALAGKTRTLIVHVSRWKTSGQDLARHPNITRLCVTNWLRITRHTPTYWPLAMQLKHLRWFGVVPTALAKSLQDCTTLSCLDLMVYLEWPGVEEVLNAIGHRLRILTLFPLTIDLSPTRLWYSDLFTHFVTHLAHFKCCSRLFTHDLIAALPPSLQGLDVFPDSGMQINDCCTIQLAFRLLVYPAFLPAMHNMPNCIADLWRRNEYLHCLEWTECEERCSVLWAYAYLTRSQCDFNLDQIVYFACVSAQRAIRERRNHLQLELSKAMASVMSTDSRLQTMPNFGQAVYNASSQDWQYRATGACACCRFEGGSLGSNAD